MQDKIHNAEQEVRHRTEVLHTAQLKLLEAEHTLELLERVLRLRAGEVVHFTTGRGPTRTTQIGTVLGVQDTGRSVLAKVFVGEGNAAEILTVKDNAITAVALCQGDTSDETQ